MVVAGERGILGEVSGVEVVESPLNACAVEEWPNEARNERSEIPQQPLMPALPLFYAPVGTTSLAVRFTATLYCGAPPHDGKGGVGAANDKGATADANDATDEAVKRRRAMMIQRGCGVQRREE